MTNDCVVTRLQNSILHFFGKYKSWASIPKFLHMRKYAEDIRRYGMTALTTTGPKESYNKTLRAAWQFTNKKNSTLQEQVSHIQRHSMPFKSIELNFRFTA